MNRRTVLEWLVNAGGAVVAGVVAVPALITGLSPVLRWRPAEIWVPVGRLEDVPVGETREGTAEVRVPEDEPPPALAEKGVYVWRPDDDEVVVFSRNCTDLSCPVNWDPGSACFYCPCHGGIFAQNGDRMAGPPRRPLYRYATRIRDGELQIDLNSLPPMT